LSYVNYNQSLYRTGFRPYGQTNPQAAAQLSGYPFTRSGGWALSGLGQIVPDQAIITYRGQWTTTALMNSNDVISAVSGALQQNNLPVVNISSDADILTRSVGGGRTFNVTLKIRVSNGMGFGQPADVASIVDHEVYVATGKMPLASNAVLSAVPSASGGASLPVGAGDVGDIGPGSPEDWTSWLQGNFTWIALTLLGVAIVPTLIRRVL
jgi:hypothetical protein